MSRPSRLRIWLSIAVGLLAVVPPAQSIAGSFAAPPAGFVRFCVQFPDQCDAPSGSARQVALTDDRRRVLQRINAAVNRAIWPQTDEAHYGRPELWTIPTDGFGDCEDYALTKRRDLIAAGLPPNALRITIAYSRRYGRHAVLMVISDRGDFILDNLTDAIVERHRSPYSWIEQQDAANPRAWVSLTDPVGVTPPRAVGSIK